LSQAEKKARLSARDRKVMALAVAFLAMGTIVGSGFLAENISETRARQYLLRAVGQSSGVVLNGERLSDPSVVLAALRRITHLPAHHSSPTDPIRITLQNGPDRVGLIIARDSDRPQEFWVYRPGSNWHNDPLGQDAGRLVSRDLDEYLRSHRL
jgi:hypothetical protein